MSKGEGKEIRSESTGVGGVFRAPFMEFGFDSE